MFVITYYLEDNCSLIETGNTNYNQEMAFTTFKSRQLWHSTDVLIVHLIAKLERCLLDLLLKS